VKVEEPVEAQCLTMLRGIVPSLEKHHKVRILDEGLSAAVHLSHRYLAGRQLPTKPSVCWTRPVRGWPGAKCDSAAIEDSVRQIDDFAVQKRILERESLVGTDHRERLQEIATKSAEIESRLAGLRTRFEKERDLVTTIRDFRSQLESAGSQNATLSRELKYLESRAMRLRALPLRQLRQPQRRHQHRPRPPRSRKLPSRWTYPPCAASLPRLRPNSQRCRAKSQ